MTMDGIDEGRGRAQLRRAVRFTCAIEVDGVCAIQGVATDLSVHGIWVAVETPLELGVLVIARIRLPRTGHVLDVAAEVTRVDANDFGFGMDLHFRGLTAIDKMELAIALRGLPPRLPRERASTLVERAEH
jgi:hypothetical protein